MTGSSTSPEMSVERDTVPAQRSSAERSAMERAGTGLDAVRQATERVYGEASRLNDREIIRPSLLPGWTRAHVVTHLARNADACVNLLTWARTGIEHPMYASRADRDADIEEGSKRLAQVIREDLLAACTRFEAAAGRMAGRDWLAQVSTRTGYVFPAGNIPWMRLFELWVHLVDLDIGFCFADVPAAHLGPLLRSAVYPHTRRTDGTPLRIRADLPGGLTQRWTIRTPAGNADSTEVSGPAPALLAWLSGRTDGAGLLGPVPELPAWG